MRRHAIIVDPVSTGQEYAAAFRDAGVEPVAVLSTPEPAESFRASWHPENFAAVHALGRDVATLADTLRGYAPICVVPGAETGVELSDALVEHLLPGTGNVPGLSAARRDKWRMALALREAGVAHLRQTCTGDPAEVAAWVAEAGLDAQPLVFKPPKSMGTDNVHVVPPGTDWRPAFAEIIGHVNKAGLVNERVLVEEFAPGAEYLVDTYSVDGRHGLVDVCRYTKIGRGDRIGIYDRVDFLDHDHPDVLALWPYTRQVLDAVGIRNGCGHSEVVLTPTGPRLLEVAARPAGGGHQLISELATGDNHILRTVAHRARSEFRPGYRLVQYVRGVFISAPRAGVWRNAEVFAEVESLKTYHAKNFPHGTGDRVPATDDLFTFLAWVILVGPDEDALDGDYRQIKEWERQIVIDPA
jgi:hypothetical protein